ncbi:MAG: hypothetical protein VB856_03595, partial [Rhodospirillales bacterium]
QNYRIRSKIIGSPILTFTNGSLEQGVYRQISTQSCTEAGYYHWSRADQFLGLKPLDLRPNLLGERKAETI